MDVVHYALHLPVVGHSAEHFLHLDNVDRFINEKLDASVVGIADHVLISDLGDHDETDIWTSLTYLGHQRDAVHAAHEKIDENYILLV